MKIPPIPRFYAILDSQAAARRGATPESVCAALVRNGVKLIQYRDKHSWPREAHAGALRLRAITREAQAVLIVNDRADVAALAGVDGVHVGQEDLPVEMARAVVGGERCVGFSTHSLDQVAAADKSSADYIAFGPVFSTLSKDKPNPVVGLEGLRRAREATRKPLVAIGGITLANAHEVLEAGADSVAVIGGLLETEDVGARAAEFVRILND